MKRLNKIAYVGAIALVGAVGFSACSSDDELVTEVNPSYNGESVKTQFAISIPQSRQGRMTAEEAQTDGNFKGMENITILTFNKASGAFNPGSDQIVGSIKLDPLAVDDLNNTAKLKVYSNVSVDAGVDHMIFYGKSSHAGYGQLTSDINSKVGGNVSAISFSPVPVYTGNLEGETEAAKILEILNEVVKVPNWKDSKTVLGKLYNEFKKLKSGSAPLVLQALATLHNALDVYVPAKSSTEETIKNALITVLDNYVQAGEGPAGKKAFTWKSGTLTNENFPENLGLPTGVVVVEFDDVKSTFKYNTAGLSDFTGSKLFTTPADIVYPPALYYHVDTDIQTSESAKINQTAGSWADAITGLKGTEVQSATTSVALTKPVQYGVGLLESSIRIQNAEIHDANGVITPNSYTMTGLLIGDQKAVDWKFEQNAEAQAKTVFDNKISGVEAEKGNAYSKNVNNTLVFESKENAEVLVAVELLNNGEDFTGADGVVKSGEKFYLVAKLNPKATPAPTNNGKTKVFTKDCKTTAKFTIKSLAKAYKGIPDLRASQMEFGLSVDLSWQDGFVFEDVDLGI